MEFLFYLLIIILGILMIVKSDFFIKLPSQEMILLKHFKVNTIKIEVFIKVWGTVCILIGIYKMVKLVFS